MDFRVVLNNFSLTKIIQENIFVCEFNKAWKMGYLDDMKLKKMKNLNEIYATFCRIQLHIGGIRDKIVGDTHISSNLMSSRKL